MKWLSNMKIGTRLIITFSIILAGLLVVCIFGSITMNQMVNDNATLMSVSVGGLDIVSDLISNYEAYAKNLLNTYYTDFSPNGSQKIISLKEQYKPLLDKSLKAYVDSAVEDVDRNNAAHLDNDLASFYNLADKVSADMTSADKDAGNTDITELLTNMDDTTSMLGTLKQYNIDFADNSSKESQSNGRRMVLIILCISAGIFILALSLAILIINSISRPVRKLVSDADRLSKGDIDVHINTNGKDEISILARSFQSVVNAIQLMVKDTSMLVDSAMNGRLATRADATIHDGEYRKIIEGVNQTLDAVVNPINVAAGQLDKIANGADSEEIDIGKFKGDFKVIIANLNETRKSLNALLDDSNMLVQAAIEGRLSARADSSRHKGNYAGIIKGINDTLDAMVKPIEEASKVLNEMSKGNLSVTMTGNYKGDHAAIKIALNDTIDALKSYIGEISTVLSEISAGNLVVGIEGEFRGDFAEIKNSISNIIDSLNLILGDIYISSEQVATGTQQVSAGSQALSQGATEQASAVEELTAALTEIAEQTRQNAVSANQANELATAAKDHALDGNTQMKDMQAAMAEINEASDSISRIIKVIDEIAFQTNLLALNAAVEAARAGQHGKGFAVVAEEVRNLAQRSANAARETTEMIEESIKKVKAGTVMANDTAQALGRIVDGIEKATALVGGIAKASGDQAMAVAQVNNGVEQVSQVVQTNSATAEESAAASEELSSQAILLKETVSRFRLKNQIGEKKVKPGTTLVKAPEVKPVKPRIALSDGEFGKY